MVGLKETSDGLVLSKDMYDEEHTKKKHILKYLVRCPALIEACQPKLDNINFFETFDDLEFIWGSVAGYWVNYHKQIQKDALLLDLELKYDVEECPFTLSQITSIIEGWFAETNLDPLHVEDLLQGYLKERTISDLREKIDSDPNSIGPTELQNYVESLRPTLREPVAKNPFTGSPNDFLFQNKRLPIGIDFVDSLLDGGSVPGEVVGFVIPSGGGKTTLVMQGVAASIKQKQHVLIVSFEQRLEGDITNRMFILASNSRRRDWKENDMAKVPLVVQEKWRMAKPLWAKHLHFYDNWVSPEFPLRSVKELFSVIGKLDAIGQKPEVLWIDWWGRMCGKLESSHPHLRSDYEKRKARQEWLHEIKSYSEDYGVRTFLMQQLAGAQAAKSSRFVASSHDAMEDKNFPQMLDYCFVASRKDKMSRVKFKLDKARSTRGDEVTVYLNGEYCRFEATAPEYTSSLLIDESDDGTNDFEE